MNIIRDRATHAGRLERWLGTEQCELLSANMRDWYGPPIAVAGVPGGVWAHQGGDFRGPIRGGGFASALDLATRRISSIGLAAARSQRATCHTGFSSLSALVEAARTGKRQDFPFTSPNLAVPAAGQSGTTWYRSEVPPLGVLAPNAPGGRAPTDATAGAFPFVNASEYVANGTMHFAGGSATAASASSLGSLLLYDRIFDVAKTMNSTATESVTGVPTRYQSTTPTAMDYGGGNFLFVELGANISNTAHNWTVCLYTDQDGNAGATLPSLTGITSPSTAAGNIDHSSGQMWFAPLATGDIGVKALTQMQCSALVASGSLAFVIGHPIAWLPILPFAGHPTLLDGINSAFSLVRIFDDAALNLLEASKGASGATRYTGQFHTVSG